MNTSLSFFRSLLTASGAPGSRITIKGRVIDGGSQGNDARFINHETQTADKCTFCEHRLEVGLLPACVESCVGGARVIGDLNDQDSEINRGMAEHKDEIKVLKPGMNTAPRVYYIGLPDEFVNGVDGQASVRLVSEH